MNKLAILAISALGTVLTAQAPAAAEPAAVAEAPKPASPHSFTGNFSLISNYAFRGLTQTNGRPAIQGGYDYSYAGGFYAGVWASNVSWIADAGNADSSALETDLYLGYKMAIKDFTIDLGAIEYYYPGSYGDTTVKPHTTEAYLGLSYKWITAKYSHVVSSDFFGFKDFKNTKYYEFNAAIPLPKSTTLSLHAGRQATSVSSSDYSYNDFKAGLAMEVAPSFTVGLAYSTANTKDAFYTNPFGKNLGGSQVALSIGKVF